MRQVAQVKTFPNFSLNPWVEYSSLPGFLLKISLRFPDKFPFKPWTERGILQEHHILDPYWSSGPFNQNFNTIITKLKYLPQNRRSYSKDIE